MLIPSPCSPSKKKKKKKRKSRIDSVNLPAVHLAALVDAVPADRHVSVAAGGFGGGGGELLGRGGGHWGLDSSRLLGGSRFGGRFLADNSTPRNEALLTVPLQDHAPDG